MPRKKPDIDYYSQHIAKFKLVGESLYKLVPQKDGHFEFIYQRKIYVDELHHFCHTDTIVAKYARNASGLCKHILGVYVDA